MRLLTTLAIIVLLTGSVPVKAQVIEWQENRPLVWKDFAGKPDLRSGYSAATSSAITYSYERKTTDSVNYYFSFKVRCTFDTQVSFVRSKEHHLPDLLAHEQLHFDISELYARKLADAFRAAVFTDNYEKEMDDLYHKILGQCGDMQTQYDQQVYRSLNMQLRWQMYVYLLLKRNPRNY
ncbi:DUF922 domain-containing protein [Mucilaginibacter myungsuensis]|uniref:DUF922 domain-containing protein n=1 Tax=Mucilaginibacter myungsuensis TaxID=649104 RepID=A0A929KUB0_9SPHI|nr:hypothetical protein [Mucilaginibacter myungsuensis]MBE9660565.1 hypothetical protein [Mucilaginibacter myungsuensis]MDN3600609.1 hypothetical protein [Mucilaginibacter myungsuensis]